MLYGDHDWMDPRHAQALIEGPLADRPHVKLSIVPNAGHNLVVDNARGFVEAVAQNWR